MTTFNPLHVTQLDANIQRYTIALYRRAGGLIEYIFDGSAIDLSNPTLYNKCFQKATNKYTKQIKQGN